MGLAVGERFSRPVHEEMLEFDAHFARFCDGPFFEIGDKRRLVERAGRLGAVRAA